MDKIERLNCYNDKTESLQMSNVLDTLDKIVDWLTAHDERDDATNIVVLAQRLRDLEAKVVKVPTTDFMSSITTEQNSLEIQPLCRKCNRSCKQYGGCGLEECSEYGGVSISDELEAGLKEHNKDNPRYPDGTINTCTYILLPMTKYEEFIHSKWNNGQDGINFKIREHVTSWLFHDIPVYSYSGDEIKYCTD